MFKSISFFSLFLALVVFTSCDPEEMVQPEDMNQPGEMPSVAPEIPPAEMYLIPIASFTETDVDTTNSTNRLSYMPSYKNWGYSAVNLVAWNTATAIYTAIPLTAFGLAANTEPIKLEDDTWEYTYQFQAPESSGGKTYDIVLTAEYFIQFGADWEVAWKMSLSEEGGFQNFQWFEGIVALDFTSAQFALNQNPNNPSPAIEITYEGALDLPNPLNSEVNLRYTNVDPGSETLGRYLEYRSDPENPFAKAYDIKGNDESIEIQWNVPGGGRVKDSKFFEDNEWHCWDESLQDTDC